MRPMKSFYCLCIILLVKESRAGSHGGRGKKAVGVIPKNWFQDGVCLIQDGLEEFSGLCVWGQNCGGGCAQYEEYGIEAWNDDLDKACLDHDICLCNALSVSERRTCDKTLEIEAGNIAEANDQCTGLNNLNPFCVNDGIVCAAYNIEDAMRVVGSGDTINNNCYVNNQNDQGSDEYEYEYEYEYDNKDEYEYEYEYDEDYAPEPKPAPSPSPKPKPEPEPTEAPKKLEKFNFEMDWNPTSCYGDSDCEDSKQVNAFTISEMTAKLEDREAKNTRCMGKNSDEAKELNVTDTISKGTLRALECIYANAAGDNEEMWHSLYVNVGSCTGLSVRDYFDTMVQLYDKVNLNSIIYGMGIADGTSVLKKEVDRDTLLDTVSASVGKKAWIECDPDLMMLRIVLVCVNPDPPYDIIDCTMDRNDPTSTNGIPCDGMLKLPAAPVGKVSDTCQPYMPFSIPTPPPAVATIPSPSIELASSPPQQGSDAVPSPTVVNTGSTSNAQSLMMTSSWLYSACILLFIPW
ncbi:hypothetical protein M9435_005120 [Picochlorum sp. BPE23]|nr:hypothetical protein M9435_005120 [Picochlorum sp. BPE23]